MIQKVCINDTCYQIVRLIKNGTSYSKEFLDSVRDNVGADTMINDNQGNILLCKTMLTYELNEEKNIWESTILFQNPESKEEE